MGAAAVAALGAVILASCGGTGPSPQQAGASGAQATTAAASNTNTGTAGGRTGQLTARTSPDDAKPFDGIYYVTSEVEVTCKGATTKGSYSFGREENLPVVVRLDGTELDVPSGGSVSDHIDVPCDGKAHELRFEIGTGGAAATVTHQLHTDPVASVPDDMPVVGNFDMRDIFVTCPESGPATLLYELAHTERLDVTYEGRPLSGPWSVPNGTVELPAPCGGPTERQAVLELRAGTARSELTASVVRRPASR